MSIPKQVCHLWSHWQGVGTYSCSSHPCHSVVVSSLRRPNSWASRSTWLYPLGGSHYLGPCGSQCLGLKCRQAGQTTGRPHRPTTQEADAHLSDATQQVPCTVTEGGCDSPARRVGPAFERQRMCSPAPGGAWNRPWAVTFPRGPGLSRVPSHQVWGCRKCKLCRTRGFANARCQLICWQRVVQLELVQAKHAVTRQ